jgi:hypothetical protein
MSTRRIKAKSAQTRQAVRVALSEGPKSILNLHAIPEIKKLAPNHKAFAQLVGRMVAGKEIRKTGYAQYATLNGAGAETAMAPRSRAAPGFVQRIAHIEHMLEQLMKALEVKEPR